MFNVMIIYVIGVFVTFFSIKFFNKKVQNYDKISLILAIIVSIMSWAGMFALICVSCIVIYEKLKEKGKLEHIINLYKKADKWFKG